MGLTGRLLLEVEVPRAALSTNHLYYQPRGSRRRILTKDGEALKNAMREYIGTAWKKAGMPAIETDYMLELEVYFRFPKTKVKTSSRFHRLDITNYIKCVEDGLVESLGIDDRQHFRVHLHKCEGPAAFLIRLWHNEDEPQWPIPSNG